MPLPTLQQFNAPLYQPATMKLQGMKIKDDFDRTKIAKQGLEETKKHNDAITLFKGYDVAFKNARSEDEFRQIVKETTGKDTNVKFKIEEQEVDGLEVLGSDGRTYKMYGPKEIVLDSISAIANDPTWLTDPQKRSQTMAHLKNGGVTVVPTKDAGGTKKDQGLDKISDYATFYRGFKNDHPELNGGNLDSAATKAWADRKAEEGASRGAGFAKSRATSVIDTHNQNRPITMSVFDVIKGNKDEPGRYLTASPSERALNRTALIEDIRGTISNVTVSLNDMDDFTNKQKAQVALVMKQRSPTSAISKFLGGVWADTLSPVQQDYLIDLAQLIENAMAMRSVLGAGQGSDDLREAIKATIPGPSTPNKQYALKQLKKFEQVLNRLERGVLKVPLREKESGRDYGAETSSDQPTDNELEDPLGIR